MFEATLEIILDVIHQELVAGRFETQVGIRGSSDREAFKLPSLTDQFDQ